MTRTFRAFRVLAPVLALLVTSLGCAMMSMGPSGEGSAASAPMDQARAELIFSEQVDAIEGPSGALRTVQDGIEIYMLTDPASDRMQLIASVAPADQVDPRFFNIILQANHFLTGDARYSVSNGVIFAVYVHPLASLTRDQLISGLEQVMALSRNFGSTFSSGKIDLGAPGGSGR